MTAPSPDVFDAACRTLIAEIKQLQNEFRWASGVAYSQQVIEQAHVTSGRPDRDGDIVRAALKGTDPNPMHSTAFDHAGLRGQLTHAAITIRASTKAVSLDVDKLKEKMLRDERPHGVFDPMRNPRSLDPLSNEHAELLEAQARRRERGEEVGVGRSPSAKELDPSLFGSRRRRPR
jgi:hypothetical protein